MTVFRADIMVSGSMAKGGVKRRAPARVPHANRQRAPKEAATRNPPAREQFPSAAKRLDL
jgi:hypothetical protein